MMLHMWVMVLVYHMVPLNIHQQQQQQYGYGNQYQGGAYGQPPFNAGNGAQTLKHRSTSSST